MPASDPPLLAAAAAKWRVASPLRLWEGYRRGVTRSRTATPARTNRHSRCAQRPPWRSPRFPPSRLMRHLPGRSEGARPSAREGRCRTSLNCSDLSRPREAVVRLGPADVRRMLSRVGRQPPPRSPAMSAVPRLAAGGSKIWCAPERLQGVRKREFEGWWRPTPYVKACATPALARGGRIPTLRPGRCRISLEGGNRGERHGGR